MERFTEREDVYLGSGDAVHVLPDHYSRLTKSYDTLFVSGGGFFGLNYIYKVDFKKLVVYDLNPWTIRLGEGVFKLIRKDPHNFVETYLSGKAKLGGAYEAIEKGKRTDEYVEVEGMTHYKYIHVSPTEREKYDDKVHMGEGHGWLASPETREITARKLNATFICAPLDDVLKLMTKPGDIISTSNILDFYPSDIPINCDVITSKEFREKDPDSDSPS